MRPTRAPSFLFSLVLVGLSTLVHVHQARAVFLGNVQGGTDFPAGSISFADVVVDYSPILVGSHPSLPHRNPSAALGLPDYADATGALACSDAPSCTFVSLGDGGSLTLRFTDNALTGSGDASLDLWIFEVGADIEDTFVEISSDGNIWHSVGKVFGSTAGVDIDAFFFGPGTSFSFVRLTDEPNLGEQSGIFVGSDIDAVGAISTVPEPTSAILIGGCIAVLAAVSRGRSCSPSRERSAR